MENMESTTNIFLDGLCHVILEYVTDLNGKINELCSDKPAHGYEKCKLRTKALEMKSFFESMGFGFYYTCTHKARSLATQTLRSCLTNHFIKCHTERLLGENDLQLSLQQAHEVNKKKKQYWDSVRNEIDLAIENFEGTKMLLGYFDRSLFRSVVVMQEDCWRYYFKEMLNERRIHETEEIYKNVGEVLERYNRSIDDQLQISLKTYDDIVHEASCTFNKICEQEYNKLAETFESIGVGFIRSILASFHIVKRISLAGISILLKQINQQVDNMVLKEVAVYCCFLLNPANKCYLMWLSPKSDEEKWHDAKWEMMKKFIKTQFKENPNDRNHLQFLSRCAQQLGDFRLSKFFEKKVARFQHNTSQTCREAVKTHEVSPLQVVEADGSIYDRARDPPGQRSVYIPPGDTDKESYRLSTYIKFPPESPVNPRDLASAGFFFTGYKDRVKCFSCGLCVENWVLGDDVKASRWHRHDCQMMLGRECGNVPIGIGGIFNRFSGSSNQRAGQLVTESVHAEVQSASNLNASKSRVSQPNNTTSSAGALIRATSAPVRNELGQTARVVPRPQQANTNYPRLELASINTVHHEQLVRSLDLRSEADRFKTFDIWPSDTRTVYPADLACSGFFYLGNLDRVQCFSCGGVLRNWNYGDNVDTEHRKHFPHCRMIQGTDTRNVALTPQERAPVPNPNSVQEPPDPSESEQRDLMSMFQCLYPVSPHMRSEDNRFETFDRRWPSNRIRATARQIASAGFFYLGERDRVKCWYCNGGLQNWDPDDEPWSEHAKWFPTCEFVLQRKGPDFVHRLVSRFPRLPRPMLRGPFDVPPQIRGAVGITRRLSPPPPIIDPRVEMKRMKDELNKAMESDTVKNAQEMGFELPLIRRMIKRKLEQKSGMYESIASLVEDLTNAPAGQHSDSEDNTSDNESRSLSQPTNVKIPGGSAQLMETGTAASGTAMPMLSAGSETAEVQETPMEAEMSLPEGTTPSMEARIRELQDERMCKICLDNLADIVFMPCGHLCSCTNCAKSLRYCPICRKKIENRIRTYLS